MVKIGVAGLGRLGFLHAANIALRTTQAKLTAVCDPDPGKLGKASKDFSVKNVYADYAEMIGSGNIDAVVIVTPSELHCEQINIAIKSGLHVFCEKPLGMKLEECAETVKIVEEAPSQVFMLGFMRRFDDSYRYAKMKVEEGYIGRPVLFRSYSVDPESTINGILSYLPKSGGQFNDMAVHDFDLARWFLKSEPISIYAVGGCFAHPEFAAYKDGDNVAALLQFENEAMAFFLAGRTASHGYNIETEIIGTKATIRIGSVPQLNLVELLDESGIRKECFQAFPARFGPSFELEMQEFIDCIIQKRKPGITVFDGYMASRIASWATESFQQRKLIKLK